MRVLVIAGDPDRIQLLEEAFGEMEDLRFAKPAYPVCLRDYALDWREAHEILLREDGSGPAYDAVLLDISQGCAPSAHAAFAALRSAAPPAAAILLLASADGEADALGLVRMGAQDYLIGTEIDCAPLGRMLRCAVERSRFSWSRHSVSMVDDLTGLYNRHGMSALAARDDRLAAALELHRWSVEAGLGLRAGAVEDQDLHRLELAEQLVDLAAGGFLAGRIAANEFVLSGLSVTAKEAAMTAERTANELLLRCEARRIPVSTRVACGLDAALCENR